RTVNDGESGSRQGMEALLPAPRTLSFHLARVALGVALALLTYALFRTAPAVDLPIYEVGSVASDNVISPFAFHGLTGKDELEKGRTSIGSGVEPVFGLVPAALDSAKQSLNAFGAAIGQAATATPQNAAIAVQRAASGWGITLTTNQAAYLGNPTRRAAMLQ